MVLISTSPGIYVPPLILGCYRVIAETAIVFHEVPQRKCLDNGDAEIRADYGIREALILYFLPGVTPGLRASAVFVLKWMFPLRSCSHLFYQAHPPFARMPAALFYPPDDDQ